VGKKLHDEHFSVFKSAWSRVRFLVAAGIVDRRWCLPNPSSGIPTVEAELPIEAFIPPYLGRAI
jgi:hypothetical protein